MKRTTIPKDLRLPNRTSTMPLKCSLIGSGSIYRMETAGDWTSSIRTSSGKELANITRYKAGKGKFLYQTMEEINPGAELVITYKPHGCLECNKRFPTLSALSQHEKKNHIGEKRYECVECRKGLSTSVALRNHMETHRRTAHDCSECGRRYATLRDLEMHRTKHTGVVQYKCPECPLSFGRWHDLSLHRVIHTNKHKCNECGEHFSSKNELFSHTKIHLKPSSHKNIHQKRPQNYKCLECGQSFSEKCELLSHNMIHNRELHKCSECGDVFHGKHHLILHRQIHLQEKLYKCLICGQSFDEKCELLLHNIIHKIELHKCSDCGEVFPEKLSLTVHRKIHLPKNLYKCGLYGQNFAVLLDLVSHRMIHFKEQPQNCPDSKKPFSEPANLKRSRIIVKLRKRNKKEHCGESSSTVTSLKQPEGDLADGLSQPPACELSFPTT